jgi:hypothetical protein
VNSLVALGAGIQELEGHLNRLDVMSSSAPE